jgi:hypothetical protein
MKRLVASVWIVVALCVPAWSVTNAAVTASQQENQLLIAGDHFRLSIDGRRGGQISEIQLFDGSAWNRLLGADGQTCPDLKIHDSDTEFTLDKCADVRIEKLETTPEVVRFQATASPCSADGRRSPWTVRLEYEIYAEGAVFVTMRLVLPQGEATLTGAEILLRADRAVVEAAKYREQTFVSEKLSGAFQGKGLSTARIAFGVSPDRSFTNEVQAILENKRSLTGEAGFSGEKGRFTWRLAEGPKTFKGPFEYANRFALGLGSAATGKPKTNVVAQRVYHWSNWANCEEVLGAAWYPTDVQIDKMVANHATMLILHEHWMDEEGNNGDPHANYVPRDEEAFTHMIRYAHEKGLRVGVYSRGVERYLLAVGFFEKYLKRDWDGLYVDWSGAYDVAHHENLRKPDSILGDAHLSADGFYVPAREWFLYTKRLRDLVGPRGFLIAHQGFGSTGVLANLVVDAYLPGESSRDHQMFANLDDAIYQGMMGGCVCMPWTVDAPAYITQEGIAKMAAWGFYPHACLAFQRPARAKRPAGTLFPADPDDPANAYVLPYWRVLAAIDAERATVYNSPAVNLVAATTSDASIPCLVYKQSADRPEGEAILVVAANLGDKPTLATITLNRDVLGMAGTFQLARVDSQTGSISPVGAASNSFKTSELAPWQIEGWKLTRP